MESVRLVKMIIYCFAVATLMTEKQSSNKKEGKFGNCFLINNLAKT